MNTEQLIQAMAADTGTERPVEAALPRAILATALVVGLVFLVFVGPRADPAAALTEGNVAIKQLFPVLLALGGFGAVARLARPGAAVGRWAAVLAAVPLMLAAAVVVALATLPRADWSAAMMGETHWFCLVAIPAMSLPILAVSLWALARGANTRRRLTGAVAGLMSGGVATALYAIHCPEDSPMFYATWYVLGILIVTAIGALLGPRALRW